MSSSPADETLGPLKGHRALGWLTLLLVLACFWVAREFAGTLVLASWLVTTFHGQFLKLSGRTNESVAALILTLGISLIIVAPVALAVALLTTRTMQFAEQGLDQWSHGDPSSALNALLGQVQGQSKGFNLEDIYRQAASAAPGMLAGVGKAFQVASEVVVKMFLFVLFVYGLFANGRRAKAWIARVSPFASGATSELMTTYVETGRGILVGVFLIVILHGTVASIGYALVRVPHALELGGLTALAGIVPGLGTGLVWLPLAIVLALTGHVAQAGLVVGVGVVVGSVDNLLRPWLSKLGEVPLPTLPLFLAFFAGLAVFGGAGILLGPLLFAMSKRALELYAEPGQVTIDVSR